jgi:hypothetical protein
MNRSIRYTLGCNVAMLVTFFLVSFALAQTNTYTNPSPPLPLLGDYVLVLQGDTGAMKWIPLAQVRGGKAGDFGAGTLHSFFGSSANTSSLVNVELPNLTCRIADSTATTTNPTVREWTFEPDPESASDNPLRLVRARTEETSSVLSIWLYSKAITTTKALFPNTFVEILWAFEGKSGVECRYSLLPTVYGKTVKVKYFVGSQWLLTCTTTYQNPKTAPMGRGITSTYEGLGGNTSISQSWSFDGKQWVPDEGLSLTRVTPDRPQVADRKPVDPRK